MSTALSCRKPSGSRRPPRGALIRLTRRPAAATLISDVPRTRSTHGPVRRVRGSRSAGRSRVWTGWGLRLIDFEAEVRDAQRALHEVERATARKDREVRAAVERWE